MAISYHVEVQPIALRDMADAVTYIAGTLNNPAAATRLAERLTEGIKSLSKLPTRCPIYTSKRPLAREYRSLRIDNYLVFFTVSEKNEVVTIARVLYARRDVNGLLK